LLNQLHVPLFCSGQLCLARRGQQLPQFGAAAPGMQSFFKRGRFL